MRNRWIVTEIWRGKTSPKCPVETGITFIPNDGDPVDAQGERQRKILYLYYQVEKPLNPDKPFRFKHAHVDGTKLILYDGIKNKTIPITDYELYF